VNSNFAGAILIFSDYHLPVDLVDLIDSLDLGAFCAVSVLFRFALSTLGDQQALQQGRPIGPANWQLVP